MDSEVVSNKKQKTNFGFLMKAAIITRSTLYTVAGGDTLMVTETARHLRLLGIEVDIRLTHEEVAYDQYDLLHFYNLIRPADILYHVKKTNRPVVVSPVLVDYSEYDRRFRRGFSGFLFRHFSPAANEYFKTIGRWLLGKDRLQSRSYLYRGHHKSMQKVLDHTALVLPNSESEWKQLHGKFHVQAPAHIIPMGVDTNLFHPRTDVKKDPQLVICAARIEGIKNQLSLIRALNNTNFRLLLIGAPAPNQLSYYRQCRAEAAANIEFIDRLPQEELALYYAKAKVHALPSWFETCGIASLEAAVMGCSLVITDKGFTRDYFGDHAEYCDPENPASIRAAVIRAAQKEDNDRFRKIIQDEYTWPRAAEKTAAAYKTIC
jgi:glycosyltransferase involved in cell wall biosynthesis